MTGSHTTSQKESDAREEQFSHDMYRDISGSAKGTPEDTRTFRGDSNGMCPIIPLESDVAIERTIRVVRILLGDLESNTNDNVDEHSVLDLEHEDVNNNKHKSF